MRVRFASAADAARIADVYRPYVETTSFSFEEVAPDADEMAARLSRDPRFAWLVAEDGGEVLGYAPCGPHRARPGYRWSVEVGVYVDAARHRGGVGRALYTALLDLLRAQGFANAYAGVTQPNPTSMAFHRALGFEELGCYRKVGFKFGQWLDTVWLERRLAALEPPREGWIPPDPVPAATVADRVKGLR